MTDIKDQAINAIQTASQRNKAAALVEVEQQRAVAEIQAMMVVAKKFPRDQIRALELIEVACARLTLAQTALYTYARGGTDIEGPSIRLAEAIAQNWGNIQFGVREIDQKEGASTVEAFAWDMETNVRQVKIFQVVHKRFTRTGSYRLEDPRDIYEMVANHGARRVRACILGVIPGDVTELAVEACKKTLTSKVKITPEKIKSLVEKFAEYSVTQTQIEKRIQRRVDAMKPGHMVSLGKIYNSLEDGMSNPVDWFEPEGVGMKKKTEMAVEQSTAGKGDPEKTQGSRSQHNPKLHPESESSPGTDKVENSQPGDAPQTQTEIGQS